MGKKLFNISDKVHNIGRELRILAYNDGSRVEYEIYGGGRRVKRFCDLGKLYRCVQSERRENRHDARTDWRLAWAEGNRDGTKGLPCKPICKQRGNIPNGYRCGYKSGKADDGGTAYSRVRNALYLPDELTK